MIFTRTDNTLTVLIDTGIGYNYKFTATAQTAGTAEAWRVHLQNQQNKLQDDRYNVELELERANAIIAKLHRKIRKLEAKCSTTRK